MPGKTILFRVQVTEFQTFHIYVHVNFTNYVNFELQKVYVLSVSIHSNKSEKFLFFKEIQLYSVFIIISNLRYYQYHVHCTSIFISNEKITKCLFLILFFFKITRLNCINSYNYRSKFGLQIKALSFRRNPERLRKDL